MRIGRPDGRVDWAMLEGYLLVALLLAMIAIAGARAVADHL